MKNFDEARQLRKAAPREFQIGGKQFVARASVSPEAIVDWNEAVSGGTDHLNEREWLALFDATVIAILEPGQEATWRELRSPTADDPLNISDIREVLQWLIEQATGRPTGEPSGSPTGSPQTETALKAVS